MDQTIVGLSLLVTNNFLNSTIIILQTAEVIDGDLPELVTITTDL